jgi:hypothetical protein
MGTSTWGQTWYTLQGVADIPVCVLKADKNVCPTFAFVIHVFQVPCRTSQTLKHMGIDILSLI